MTYELNMRQNIEEESRKTKTIVLKSMAKKVEKSDESRLADKVEEMALTIKNIWKVYENEKEIQKSL